MILRHGCGYGYSCFGYSDVVALAAVAIFCGLFTAGYSRPVQLCHDKADCGVIVRGTIWNIGAHYRDYAGDVQCFKGKVDHAFWLSGKRRCVHGDAIMDALIACVIQNHPLPSYVRQLVPRRHAQIGHAGLAPIVRQGGPTGSKDDKRICKSQSPCCSFKTLDADVRSRRCMEQHCTYWEYYLFVC